MSDKLEFVAGLSKPLMHHPRQTELCRTLIATTLCLSCLGLSLQKNERPRARDIGLTIGLLPVGPLNAMTDLAGVQVGYTTIIRGETVRTGATAILPRAGNLFREISL